MASTAAPVCEERVQAVRERRPCDGPRGLTLGQLLERAREHALAGGATCPVCTSAMHAHGTAARCGGCGSRLL